MQVILQYISPGSLWGLAAIALTIAVVAANCSYQKYRSLARDRIALRKLKAAQRRRQDATIIIGRFPVDIQPHVS
jgi:hypothetical protein